jgi:hypothetical protein
MNRQIVLGVLVAVGAVSVAAYQAQPAAPKVVEVEKLKDNLYLLKRGGGNTAVFVGASGVVVVDTKNPGWGQPILDQIKGITGKPVTTIINTHTHGDHVSGNVEFPATVDVVVQENTKTNMEKMALRMAHAGDIFSGKNLPLLDMNNGGSGVEIGNTLQKAHDGIKNVDSVITGHSTVMPWADLAQYAQFNKDFLADVRAGVTAGKTPDEIAGSSKLAEKYTGYTIQPAQLKSNVEAVAAEIKK